MSHSDKSSELPNWQCDDCSKSFSAMTEDQLREKARQHLSDCDGQNDEPMWTCENCGWSVSELSENYGELKGEHISKCQMQKWACKRCGQSFQAPEQQRINELSNRHESQSKCYDDPTYQPDLGDLERQEIPREPSAYRPTDHFAVRKAKRQEPPVKSDVIEKVISDGTLKTTHYKDRFFFERRIGDWTWRVLVRMHDRAFVDDSKKHHAITVYAKESDQHELADGLGL